MSDNEGEEKPQEQPPVVDAELIEKAEEEAEQEAAELKELKEVTSTI